MSDYSAWRISTQTTNAQMIDTLKTRFKRYSKSTQSMINNPERYGVCLIPEAETMLVANYGIGRGLDVVPKEIQAFAKPKQRTKPRQMSVYVTNEMYEDIRELMEAQGFATMQDFLMNLINSVLGG